MLAWLGKLAVGELVQSELGKVKGDLADLIRRGFSDLQNGRTVKQATATYLDGILAEGQQLSKDQLDAWFIQKRDQIKAWGLQ